MAKKRSKKTAKKPARPKRPAQGKASTRQQAPAVVTVIRFRCAGGKCTVRPKRSPNIGRGAVFLVAENTSVTIDFLKKGSPFVNKTDPITIAEGGFALHFVDPDADGGYPFTPKACDNCDEIQGLVPPEMIVP